MPGKQDTPASQYKSSEQPPKPKKTRTSRLWRADFEIPEPPPEFQWGAPVGYNPAERSDPPERLLLHNTFIDKSAALYQLLENCFDASNNNFVTIPLLLVYPRRFAKTTLLRFIKAVYTPLSKINGHDSTDVKSAIASLDKGPELLAFGMHPVLYLDMISIMNVADLKLSIVRRLKSAGLEADDVSLDVSSKASASAMVRLGLEALNQRFLEQTGKETQTIVLIDEYDQPFRTPNPDQELLAELINIYNLTKEEESGVSLLVLCGLTRIVETGLSELNKLVDVSQQLKYHGICGLSSGELVSSVGTQLDSLAQKKYNRDFKGILETEIRVRWDGFQFGFRGEKGMLDAATPSGALFSPIDAWELIRSLSIESSDVPTSQWMETMQSEFEFASFDSHFTQSDEKRIELLRMLGGGWLSKKHLGSRIKREDYITLKTEIDLKKVLFELGLLTVKKIDDSSSMVLLGSPNWAVTENAVAQLIGKIGQGQTDQDQANSYLSEDGLNDVLSVVTKNIDNQYGMTGNEVMREYPFQDHTYFELLLRFPKLPESDITYELYREASTQDDVFRFSPHNLTISLS